MGDQAALPAGNSHTSPQLAFHTSSGRTTGVQVGLGGTVTGLGVATLGVAAGVMGIQVFVGRGVRLAMVAAAGGAVAKIVGGTVSVAVGLGWIGSARAMMVGGGVSGNAVQLTKAVRLAASNEKMKVARRNQHMG